MPGSIINRGKNTWLVRLYFGANPDSGKREYHNKTIRGNKGDAQTYLVEALRDRNRGHLTAGAENRTLAGLFDDLLADYRINRKRIDWAEILIEKHLRPFLGKVSISKFSTSHIQRYIAHRQAEGVCNGTNNREFTLLRRSLNLGRMSTPPKVKRAPRIPRLAENSPRKGFFEHEAYTAMRKELPAEIRPILTFAYYAGVRRGELLMIQWPQVDLIERIVRLEPGETKNHEPRTIPPASELYETLKMQRAIRDERFPDCPWVFFRHQTGECIRDFRDAWEFACERAGLWSGDKKTGKPTKLFHDLRRTGVRNLVRAGVPERVAMMISGHKTRSVFDRYNIVSEADLKEAARRLSVYVASKESHKEGTIDESIAFGEDTLSRLPS